MTTLALGLSLGLSLGLAFDVDVDVDVDVGVDVASASASADARTRMDAGAGAGASARGSAGASARTRMSASAGASATGGGIDACRARRDAFDVDGMIALCAEAADNANLDVASRIFALRLLAGAHVLNDDEQAAEMVLVRMLALDAEAAPAPDDGPAFRAVLARARARVLDDDALRATFLRDGQRAVSVRVVDRYARAARADLVDINTKARVPLARIHDAPGVSSFALPADVSDDAVVEITGWTNKVIVRGRVGGAIEGVAPSVADASAPRTAAHDVVGWTLVGVGSLAALAGAIVGGATWFDLNYRESCSADPANGCIPNRPLLFGIYGRDNRADLFAHQSAWLGGSLFAVTLGALTATAGVGVLTYE